MKKVIFILTLLFFTFASTAQWQSTNGPFGASKVNDILETDSGLLFIATNGGGIFRSSDEGISWEEMNQGVVSGMISSMAINSNGVVFAADSGVIRSFDEGLNWERCNNGIGNPAISSLATDGSGQVYAAAYSAQGGLPGIYVSSDNGDSWELRQIGVDYSDVIKMGISPQGHIFIGSNGFLKRSLNGGQSWEDLSPGIGSNYKINSFDFSDGMILVGAGIEGGVLRSEDNGDTWQLLQSGDITSVAFSSEGDYYAGIMEEGVLYSNDNGLSWNYYLNGLPHAVINDLCYTAGTMLAATAGIYRFEGDGSPWTWSSEGITASTPVSMAADSNGNLFALTDRLWRYDGGPQWTDISAEITDEMNKIVAMHDTLYLSAGSNLYFSSDNGENWVLLSVVDTTIEDFDINSAGDLFVMTFNGLLRSVDNGNTWSNIGYAGEVMYLMINDVTGTIILSDDYPSLYLYRSTDNGNSWAQDNPLGFVLPAEAFAEDAQGNIYIATSLEVIRSADDGITWEDITPEGIEGNNTHIASDTAGRLFLSGKWGLLMSPDRGVNWNDYGQGLFPWGWIEIITVSPDGYLYAGYDSHSVSRREIVTKNSNIPLESGLRIYPNPASGTITITDNSERKGSSTIQVTDLAGKVVKVILLSGKTTKADISDLLPGVYIFSTSLYDGTRVLIRH